MYMDMDMDITSIILITSPITIIMRTIKSILTTDTDSLMVMLCTFTIITITSTTARDSEMATETYMAMDMDSNSFILTLRQARHMFTMSLWVRGDRERPIHLTRLTRPPPPTHLRWRGCSISPG